MKLWLQVLFAQGYLWRDRFPSAFIDPNYRASGSVWGLVFGLLFLGAGVSNAVYWEDWAWAFVFFVTGGAFLTNNIGLVQVDRLFGDQAFWVSVSWASGALIVAGIVGIIIMAAISLAWLALGLFLAYMALPGTCSLNAIERRLLFFADPSMHGDVLACQADSYWGLLRETYWQFPKEILFGAKRSHTETGR